MSSMLDITTRLCAARSIADSIPEMLPMSADGGQHYDLLNKVSNLTLAIVDLLDLAEAHAEALEREIRH